jgi:hypothetical protein
MFNMTPTELQEFLHERAFTSEEVIEITGVDKFSFRNWLKRGTPEIGYKHRLGRWAFSPADMMRVSAMVDLVENFGVSPSWAVQMSEEPVSLLESFISATERHMKADGFDGYSVLPAPLDRFVALAYVSDDGLTIARAYWDGDCLRFPGVEEGELTERLHSLLGVTHVVLGAGLIADDIMEKALMRMDEVAE